MRAVVQRVSSAKVSVDGDIKGEIGRGLCVLLAASRTDGEAEVEWMAEKITGLRIFEDDQGKMNLSLADVGGSVLAVSQFTLYGDCRKGRRPGFDAAAPPAAAQELYEYFLACCRELGVTTHSGRFQAEMVVKMENHGPVTMLLDSGRLF
jgi:D-tyrosyl-tRNA(Tyr) deacylase